MKKCSAFLFSVILLSSLSTQLSAQSNIVMNEIYARGTSNDPDWIEIYNSSNESIDISSYKIYDSGGQTGSKPKKEFPNETMIPAKGYFVIVVDDTASSGFGLSSSGEKVWLENSTGTIIDSVEFLAHSSTQSYGRFPDGGNWQILNVITKGIANSNGDDTPADTSKVLMNEIYARGTSDDPDWIEIYNSSNESIDISSYKIYDSGGQTGSKPKKEFPNETMIPAKGYFVIVVDDTSSSGFGLSSSGEKVWLENSTGTIIDSVEFLAHTTVQSYGRIPDGGNWQVLNSITKGNTNGTGVSVQLSSQIIDGFSLNQNYPNPFNPSTMISFSIPVSGTVTLKIYDNLGREISTLVSENFPAGNYFKEWNAENFPSGIYFCRLISGSFSATQKLVLMK